MRVISFLITLLFFFHGIEAKSISTILKNIPKEDRESLDNLFSFLIKEDQFGYTLFGDKPISLSSHFVITPWENIVEHVNDEDGIFWKHWSILERYQKLLLMKDYLLIKEKSRNKNITSIILINKNEFIKIVNKNQKLFEAILGHKISPKEILNRIESGKETFIDSIDDHQALWGILLIW